MYRGRFAPSPTGPLHFGSLVAATASYLDARAHQGSWLVRMEDTDGPRCRPQWATDILTTLAHFGFAWEEPVLYQSTRSTAYQHALTQLQPLLYPCTCSRKTLELAAAHTPPGLEPTYPGTCRNAPANPAKPPSWRIRVPNTSFSFTDRLQGPHSANLTESPGDFILLRADGIWSYQLAVVVDDHAQSITHIVRGSDLLTSTPRQLFLQQTLRYATPSYLHLPVATSPAGEKLSKQTLAPAIDPRQAVTQLLAALAFLGQPTPPADTHTSLPLLWQSAIANWEPTRIPRALQLPV